MQTQLTDLPDATALALLTESGRAFSRAGWFFELKYDGFRALARRGSDGVSLLSRNNKTLAPAFPEIIAAVAELPFGTVLDAELVLCDPDGRPNFEALQSRARLRRSIRVVDAAYRQPALLYAFDLLFERGKDLRTRPLHERKARLANLLGPPTGVIRIATHIDGDGIGLFEHAVALKIEGIVAKRADSVYRAGRTRDWLRIKRPGWNEGRKWRS